MSRRGAKNVLASAARVRQQYTAAVAAVWALYTILTLLAGQLLTLSGLITTSIFAAISYAGYINIIRSAELGTPYDGWQDLLIITSAVQILSCLTAYAYLLYLTIPAYLFYQYGYVVRNLFGAMKGGGNTAQQPQSRRERRDAQFGRTQQQQQQG